jgi:hypothetical protein
MSQGQPFDNELESVVQESTRSPYRAPGMQWQVHSVTFGGYFRPQMRLALPFDMLAPPDRIIRLLPSRNSLATLSVFDDEAASPFHRTA